MFVAFCCHAIIQLPVCQPYNLVVVDVEALSNAGKYKNKLQI